MCNSFVLSFKTLTWIALLLFSSGLLAQKTKYKIEATLNPETELIDVKQEILPTQTIKSFIYCIFKIG